MFQPKSLQLIVVLTLFLSLPYFNFEAYGDALENPNCDPPCQQYSPPPISGYPSYGAPPPPPSGYSIYTAPPPPPPPHHEKGQSKCPPAGGGVECCTPPAPITYGPPNPNTFGPPNPYTYVPYGEGGRSTNYVVMQFVVPIFMFCYCFILF
ncbi:cleavage and polyadenylation specificity factor subunit 6 [Trifolium pratense]|uniref:cleavage and polyadenylation specificity factor subunit 6 n=1 Tax=Trifolium pratense TaxID=57577 RepID=UPI001E697E29|nr:cleavage and polyadenylation specificity factor subunit 6 [Trifolium pratense]